MQFLAFCDDTGAWGFKHPADVDRFVSEQFRGKDFSVDMKAATRKRSLAQNAYLHAEPFPKLAKAWGESVARTKLICMGEFWGYEPCRVTRQFLPVKVHTSDMTVEECVLFIDWLVPWAMTEHGVSITLPDEREVA